MAGVEVVVGWCVCLINFWAFVVEAVCLSDADIYFSYFEFLAESVIPHLATPSFQIHQLQHNQYIHHPN